MGRGLPASVGAAPSVRILSQLRVEACSELIGTFEGQGSESRACDTIWERLTGGSLGQDCPRASPPSCGALVGGGGTSTRHRFALHLESCSVKSGPEIRLWFSVPKIVDL